MKYLLDTNACIRYLNGRAPLLVQKLATIPRQNVAELWVINWFHIDCQ